ncbi:hypothetical protein AB0I81_34830 [Nonomuraea sp. NPDC050404]|uniref:hypothetical protein n=1 Tax=Nonomuraea sp. NPDC050404 TaxID=3155783 RepID=UPI0033DD0E12
MSVLIQGNQVRAIALGVKVSKSSGLTQNAGTNLFTVAGGLVAVTALVGRVTTAIPNTASLTMKLQHTPSGGAAADLSGATGITNDAVGTLYSLTSAVATDLLSIQSVSAIGGTPVAASEAPSVTFVHTLWRPVILPAGTLSALCSNHTPGSGVISWGLTYVPFDDGASVSAA